MNTPWLLVIAVTFFWFFCAEWLALQFGRGMQRIRERFEGTHAAALRSPLLDSQAVPASFWLDLYPAADGRPVGMRNGEKAGTHAEAHARATRSKRPDRDS